MTKPKQWVEVIILGIAACCAVLYIACDDTKKVTNTTNTTNNTTEVIQADPDPQYSSTLNALDPDINVTEVCYNNQVLYVFSKTTTTEDHKKHHKEVKQQIISIVYKIGNGQGAPYSCGE